MCLNAAELKTKALLLSYSVVEAACLHIILMNRTRLPAN